MNIAVEFRLDQLLANGTYNVRKLSRQKRPLWFTYCSRWLDGWVLSGFLWRAMVSNLSQLHYSMEHSHLRFFISQPITKVSQQLLCIAAIVALQLKAHSYLNKKTKANSMLHFSDDIISSLRSQLTQTQSATAPVKPKSLSWTSPSSTTPSTLTWRTWTRHLTQWYRASSSFSSKLKTCWRWLPCERW